MIEEIYAELELIQARVLEGLAEIPDERLAWKPTRASTSAVEITWHMASAERRLAARLRGEDPDRIDASAGTQNWIEAAARGEADVSAVPRDRSGLETALAAARSAEEKPDHRSDDARRAGFGKQESTFLMHTGAARL